MMQRVVWTFPKFPWLAVVAAAVVVASCGGSIEGESVTGSPVFVSALPALDDGTVSESGKKSKVTICHKGKNKSVPESAVKGHMRHGDSVGSCSCPCFSADDISTTARSCTGGLTPVCTIGASSSLNLLCNSGPTAGVIGFYETAAGEGSCRRTERDPSIDLNASQVTADEHQACVDAILSNGCS